MRTGWPAPGSCSYPEKKLRASWAPPPKPGRGWDRLIAEQVLQADEGCDLAIMRPAAE